MSKPELRILRYQVSRVLGMIKKLEEEIQDLNNQLATYQNPQANEQRTIEKKINKRTEAKQKLIRKKRNLRIKQIVLDI
jgi:predicted  nucleic acid-binding Zn-ribbon protein